MNTALLALACLLLAGCGTRGPLDGLSQKERRAAEAHAAMICNMAKKSDMSMADLSVALGDMAVGVDQGNPVRIVEASNALARERGCVPR